MSSEARDDLSGPISTRGEVLAAISNAIVGIHKEFYGKGPQRARTTYDGDLVVVLLHGGFTRVEKTLLDAGRGASVIQQRADFHDVMRDTLSDAVQHHTGRKVLALLSSSHQDPDLIAQVFVLEPMAESPTDAQANDGQPSS